MKMENPFPTEYQRDPKRRTERLVYDELAASSRPGVVIFEAYPPGGTEIDFAVLVEGRGPLRHQQQGRALRPGTGASGTWKR